MDPSCTWVVKKYRGYYWWNSEGEEGIKWDEFEEKPDFGENEKEIIEQIKDQIIEQIMELEKEKEDYWMLPRRKIKLLQKP